MSNLLYHYTSIETFYKMLERSLKVTEEGSLLIKFWATHCDFLNDRTEGKLFKQCLLSDLNEYASLHSHKLTDKEIEQFNKMYSVNDSFVISFSKHRDSLDMWRAYGANGKGICLGFDFSPTDPYMDSEGVFHPSETIDIKECKYFLPSENIDLKIVEDVYNKVITPELDTISAASQMARSLRFGLIYKHRAYQSESEYRLVIRKYPYEKDIKFIENTLKPYIEYPIEITRLKRIVIGPCLNPEEIKTQISQILRYKGIKKADIETSEIPYRG